MSINVNDKNLGHATAYAYYKAGGGTMTEAEFTEFMADFGTASQTAVEAAQAALASKNAAQTAATTATNKASEATTAAQTATTKAGEAQTSAQTASSKASEASQSASTASAKATEATTAAGTATTAKDDAVTAKNAAETAQGAAEDAQAAAEDAAESVSASAAQIATNTADITDLKEDFASLDISLYGGNDTSFTWVDGFVYNDSLSTNSGWQRTEPILVKAGETLSFNGGKGDTALPINAITKYENGTYSTLVSYSGISSESISYTARADIYLIVSVKKTVYSNDLKVVRIGTLKQISNYVYTNVEPTALTISANENVAFPITKGCKYLIENTGTTNITLATRLNPSAVSVDVIYVPVNSIISFKATGNASYLISNVAASINISRSDALIPFIKHTDNAVGNMGKSYPLVRFNFSTDMFDFTSELNGVDFNDTSSGWYTIPETITAKFDSLASAYPSYVTKVDAGEDAGLIYPSYANLGGSASGNYSATPTYKTYMYKLGTNNIYVNNPLNPKKKMLLLGATHGSEIAGSFNLYLFAKNLCECANEDYFKLRSAFDFYIIPCLNGYGMYHLTRWNANGVNINRNYPIKNFTVSGQAYDDDYTGASAGSEFETKIVINLHDKYNFDMAIDHHNYGSSNSQFYTESWFERFRPLSNVALVDCSYAFIRNKSAYFGTNFKLFVDIENSTMPSVLLSDSMPCMAKWFFEKDIDYAATIEISNTINYSAGALSPSADNPKYTNDVFAVGEFTLRNQLLHYCGFVLGGTGN